MIDSFSIYMTFIASVRSVGTACTMASVGVYLHRRGFIIGEGKRTLALVSQQVTIPLFLFTKIVYCNQDWSDAPCPDITTQMSDVWVLLFWPAYVVGWGLLVGWGAAWISKTPASQFRSVLVACAFGNSTGLPITLLTVVHANFPDTTELGRVDPTLFLSVYLLLYPILQWGVGGWLLAPQEEDDDDEKEAGLGNAIEEGSPPKEHSDNTVSDGQYESPPISPSRRRQLKHSGSIRRNVLNNKEMLDRYENSRRGISETDASLYISNADLVQMARRYETVPQQSLHCHATSAAPTPQTPDRSISGSHNFSSPDYQIQDYTTPQDETRAHQRRTAATATPLSQKETTEASSLLSTSNNYRSVGEGDNINVSCGAATVTTAATFEAELIVDILSKIISRCLQPPVVGAIMGLLVAATPLRGIFVDLVNRRSAAPLEWLFDGLYAIGQAAVPINMMILGCNLSASHLAKPGSDSLLSSSTMLAIVVGKMVVMPIIGIATALLFNQYIWDIPDSIDASFYLVAMIVFITPTANNVMVMVELSGSGTREGIAQVIAWEYAVAPIVLSMTMTAVVGVASAWS